MDWWEDNKRTWRAKKNSSAYSLGPGAHDSILQLVKVGLFISKDQHNSLLQAPTPFLSPIFSLSPLSVHLSLSYFLANGKTVLGRILFFQRIQFSFVHTWSDPVTDIKCVFCLIQRACILCADGHSPLTHTCTSTRAHTHTDTHPLWKKHLITGLHVHACICNMELSHTCKYTHMLMTTWRDPLWYE